MVVTIGALPCALPFMVRGGVRVRPATVRYAMAYARLGMRINAPALYI